MLKIDSYMPLYKKVNKDFFKVWTHNMAYVLGFFAADGNLIQTKRETHYFAIQITDKDLVHKIKTVMGSDHTISKRVRIGNNKELYRLQIGSKEIFEDLIALGFPPQKTKRLTLPNIPQKFLSDFVRGYFDGDGNVWSGYTNRSRKKPTLAFQLAFTSCSESFLKEIQKEVLFFTESLGSLYEKKNEKCFVLRYSTIPALKFYNFMYNRVDISEDLFLERKMKVFENYMKLRS